MKQVPQEEYHPKSSKQKKSVIAQFSMASVRIFAAVILVACAGDVAKAKTDYTLGPGDYERSIVVDKLERHYLVHAPPGYQKKKPIPVVLNFHGGGGNAETQRNFSQMDVAADRNGFIVVYPQGTSRKRLLKLREGYTWNAGSCCGWAQKHNIDDVGFTAALLVDLAKQFNINPRMVYATGYSNGAIMCYRLACELSDRIAAIAPVSGPMGMKTANCKPPRPVPIIHFHGTKDESAPYEGGAGRRSVPGQNFESVDNTISFWLKHNRLEQEKPKIIRKGNAVGKFYGSDRDNREVVLWSIEGGGHTWPGGKFGGLGKRVLGEMTQDISASDLMWIFFKRHPMPSTAN
jgi:polyhydroxybutyrate depolymerase